MPEQNHALIFDFDGLILDTESTMVVAWQEIYQEYDLHVSFDEWAKVLGQSADPSAPYEHLEMHIGTTVDRLALRERRIARELELLQNQGTLPGVDELIVGSHDAGISLGVASSSEHAWVDSHLERLGLFDYFNVIICADDVQATKPYPDLYLKALEDLGVKARYAIALEDSAHGVSSANAAGLFCIAVPNEITRTVNFHHADVVLDTLEGTSWADLLAYANLE
jgi:HAD superfamily hydrolase (TIGR01549 family)